MGDVYYLLLLYQSTCPVSIKTNTVNHQTIGLINIDIGTIRMKPANLNQTLGVCIKCKPSAAAIRIVTTQFKIGIILSQSISVIFPKRLANGLVKKSQIRSKSVKPREFSIQRSA